MNTQLTVVENETRKLNVGRLPGVPSQADTDEQLIRMWLNKRQSENTRKTYERAINEFQEYTDYKPLQQMVLDDLLGYQEHLKRAYKSASSRKLKINAVRSLFTFGSKIGYFAFNIGAVVEAPKQPNTLAERILTESEAMQVLAQPNRKQTKLIVHLIIQPCGFRS